jgi:Fusaric acid resistance protein-like
MSESLWRRVVTPTGQPPAWALVRYLVGGVVAGVALGSGLPHIKATLLSALAGAIVAASASGGPSGIARRLSFVAAGWTLAFTIVGFATGNHPVWAALAMAAVALLTSVAGAAGPLGGVLGFLLSLAYLLVAGIARTAGLVGLISVGWAAVHIAAGCVAGLLVALVGTGVRRRGEPEEVRAARAPIPLKPIVDSLRSFDEHARDGVRRAIPLAILMYFLQLDGGRDAFWTFFAAFLVLLTPGKTPTSLASVRVASTVFGVLLLAVASVILPNEVLFSFGVVILFAGIGLSPPYPIIGGGFTSIGSILMAGAPTGAIGTWSTHRLLDTVVGCAIALAANYVLWSRDSQAQETVPVGPRPSVPASDSSASPPVTAGR